MKRLLILALVIALAACLYPQPVNAMAKKSLAGQWEQASALLFGFQADMVSFQDGISNFSGRMGFVIPGPSSWLGGKFYFVTLGALGPIDNGKEYEAEARGLYFLGAPENKLSLFLIVGAAGALQDFKDTDTLTTQESVSYLLGSYGMGIYFRVDNRWGAWGGIEIKTGADYQTT